MKVCFELSPLILRLISTLSTLGVLVFASQAHATGDIDEAIQAAEKQLGGRIDPSPYPALYELISKTLADFNRVLSLPEHSGGKRKPLKGVFLIDSKDTDTNVYVVKAKEDPSDESPYAVFIPRAMISRIFQSLATTRMTEPEAEAYVKENLGILLGALAHETAHQSALYAKDKGTSLLSDAINSQFEEARADGVASEILRKSGYPKEYIVQTTDFLTKVSSKDESSKSSVRAIGSAFSSHPSGELRSSLSRLLATWDTSARGDYLRENPSVSKELVREIHLLQSKSKDSLSGPKNLKEALLSFEKSVSELKQNQDMQKVCIWDRAVSSRDWLYIELKKAEDADELTEEVKSKFLALIETMLSYAGKYFSNLYSCKEFVPPGPSPARLHEAVETLSVLHESSYLSSFWKLRSYDSSEQSYLVPFVEKLRHFSHHIQTQDPQEYTAGSNFISEVKTPNEYQILLREIQPALEKLSPEYLLQRQRYSHSSAVVGFFSLGFLNSNNFVKFWSDSETRKDLQALATFLWKNRGTFGAAELDRSFFDNPDSHSSERFKINWKYVFKILGISEDDGRREIRSAAIATVEKVLNRGDPSSKTQASDSKDFGMVSFFAEGAERYPLVGFHQNKRRSEYQDYFAPKGVTPFVQKPIEWDGPELGSFFKSLLIKKRGEPSEPKERKKAPQESKEGFLSLFKGRSGAPFREDFASIFSDRFRYGRDRPSSYYGSDRRSSYDDEDERYGFFRSMERGPTDFRNEAPYLQLISGLDSFQKTFIHDFEESLDKKLKESSTTLIKKPELVSQVWNEVRWKWSSNKNPIIPPFFKSVDWNPIPSENSFLGLSNEPHFTLLLSQWVDQKTLPRETKKAIFDTLLKEGHEGALQNAAEVEFRVTPDLKEVLPILRKYGVISSFDQSFSLFKGREFLNQVRNSFEVYESDAQKWRSFSTCGYLEQFLEFFDLELSREIEALSRRVSSNTTFLEKVKPYLDPDASMGKETERHSCRFAESPLQHSLKVIVARLLQTTESPSQTLETWSLLTHLGSNPDADRYLKMKFEALGKELGRGNRAYESRFKELLIGEKYSRSRIWGDQLKGQVFSKFLNHSFQQRSLDLEGAIEFINDRFQKESLTKDRLLEQVAWELPVDSPEILESKIQNLKSNASISNTRNPLIVKLASGIASLAEQLNTSDRLTMIRYWVDPTPKNFSDVEKLFEKLELTKSSGSRWSSLLKNIERMPMDSSPTERLPVFEFLLGSKSAHMPIPLVEQTDQFDSLIQEFLGFAPQSVQSRLLKAYLNSIPQFERPSIIAYLLAHSKEKGGGVKSVFEAFATVGVKAGQLAAIWNVFDNPDTAAELAELKDNARPMDKLEIVNILRELMGPDEFAKIKSVNRILGSASIKTVVEVEFKNGKKAAVMIRRPYAIPLVRENLARAQRFLTEVQKDPELREQARRIETIFHIAQEELKEELDFEVEREKTVQAGRVYGTLAHPQTESTSSGLASYIPFGSSSWKIAVPQPFEEFKVMGPARGMDESKPQLLMVELADGVPFTQLKNPSVRKDAGTVIVSLLIGKLLHDGFFNADPHAGNFLIHAKNKAVFPIDFGQAEQLETKASTIGEDDRTLLLKFFLAIHQKNPQRILDFGLRMTKAGTLSSVQAKKLLEAFKNTDDFQKIVNSFIEVGLPFKKKFFGVLKGLAILEKENYVSSRAEFIKIIQDKTVQALGYATALKLLKEANQTLPSKAIPDTDLDPNAKIRSVKNCLDPSQADCN